MNMVRHLAERFSRGKVFRRRLPARFGGAQFYASPEAGLRYWRRDLAAVDPALLNLAWELIIPGAVVWDIGANVGIFSFAAAGLAGPEGRVFAVEPDTYLVGVLRRSARLENSHAAPVNVIPCAVSDAFSVATFHIARRARASNFLDGHGASQTGGVRESQRVLTITLDWLATQVPPPDLIKIDTEGADLRVLFGAATLLREKQPDLLFEGYAEIAEQATQYLTGLGYSLFDADASSEARRPLALATYNTLARHSSKVGG